jgi:hypothetical protein
MKTIEVYTFNELSESAKKAALDKNRDMNVHHDWYEHVIDHWKEELARVGFLDAKISFSGFYSQGDGCSFKAELELEDHLINEFEPLFSEDTCFICSRLEGYSSYEQYKYEQNNFLSTPALDALSDEFIEYINEYARDLSREIYVELEKEYELLTSDECVSDTLMANEYHFLPCGEMV